LKVVTAIELLAPICLPRASELRSRSTHNTYK
jgi:hypothetical protein